MLRRIFRPKRDEVKEEWRRLPNKELFTLNSSPDNIRVTKTKRLRWGRGEECSTYRREKRCMQGLMENNEGNEKT
jgi:hypothetical protein